MSAVELTQSGEAWVKRNVETSKFKRVSHVGVLVTPELAAELLARNEGNRTIRKAHVKMLRDAILEGEWIETGDTIKVDAFGRLLDGQHRLRAIVEATRPVKLDIVFGVSPEAFDRIDTGYNRTVGQLFSMQGIPDGAAITAALRCIMAIDRGIKHGSGLAVSRHAVVEEFRSHPGIVDATKTCGIIRHSIGRVASTGGAIAGIYLIQRRFGKEADAFFEAVKTGANLQKESPVLQLRNRLMRATDRRKTDTVETAALFIKAFNLWHEGKPSKLLQWRPADEAFPTPGQ